MNHILKATSYIWIQIMQINNGYIPESICSTHATLCCVCVCLCAQCEWCTTLLMKVVCVHSTKCNCLFLSPGCSGALAKQCTSAYPQCTVAIFDLPKVVRMSREHFVTEADQRISFHEGNSIATGRSPLPFIIIYSQCSEVVFIFLYL